GVGACVRTLVKRGTTEMPEAAVRKARPSLIGCVARRWVIARKSSCFAAVATNGHGTPAPAPSARIIVEEHAATRIGADSKACAFGDNLCPGPGHGGEQPVKTALSGDKFDFPGIVLTDEFVVSLCDTQDFVYGGDPFREYPLLADHGREYFAQGGSEPPSLLE